jgi:tRNA-Thr(GGU) m(6)t(6)A37 methyltransferase TsaA
MRLILGFLVAGISCSSAVEEMTTEFTVRPIGWVRKAEQKTSIVVDKEFQPGLLGLEGFSHVYVFYWFDRNDNPEKRSILQVHPRGNPQNPLTGVFATRSPARPNLIALSLCRIVGIKKNVIEIDSIDALPDSPVLDLKPFIPHSEVDYAVVPDWLGDETRKHRTDAAK